jgi:SAM-dependent methyltransferase
MGAAGAQRMKLTAATVHGATMRHIVDRIEARLAERGATPEGLWWPNAEDLAVRYEVFLRPLLPAPGRPRLALLDFGCGLGFLPDWLAANGLLEAVDYTGLDASATILDQARARWPGLRFVQADALQEGVPAPAAGGRYDAVVAIGIFTARFGRGRAEMEAYARATLEALWPAASRCLAFNAMSAHVDWEREDLFHWPLDEAMRFCRARLSRHVAMRTDYGLWEYTCHVWREPARQGGVVPAGWRG